MARRLATIPAAWTAQFSAAQAAIPPAESLLLPACACPPRLSPRANFALILPVPAIHEEAVACDQEAATRTVSMMAVALPSLGPGG